MKVRQRVVRLPLDGFTVKLQCFVESSLLFPHEAEIVESLRMKGVGLHRFPEGLREMALRGEADSQCDVGDGAMPFPGIFKQLKKMNYQGCVNLEYEINGKDPMPGMYRSFSYMRGVLAGLAAA